MRIILTGSNGFLGSSLFKLLDRDHEIIHINRAKIKNSRGICIDLDLANEQLVDQAISLGNIPNADVLINLASRTANSVNQNDLSVLFDNVSIAKTVSSIALQSKVDKLINISSMSVYPNVDGEYTEESRIDPSKNSDCLYGLSKFSMEVLFDFFLKQENIIVSHLRVAMLDGEGLRPDRLMAVMEREMHEKNSITIFGNGERLINFISVKRASEIIKLFVLGHYKGVFNLGDECMSIESIAKRITSNKKNVNIIKFNNGNKNKFKLNFEKLKAEVMDKNINCNLCRSYDLKEILAKGLTTIWTNSTGFENTKKHKCLLYQCISCGHVFQPLTT
jgi:nucleoside-diphosphate-sugar epimerase